MYAKYSVIRHPQKFIISIKKKKNSKYRIIKYHWVISNTSYKNAKSILCSVNQIVKFLKHFNVPKNTVSIWSKKKKKKRKKMVEIESPAIVHGRRSILKRFTWAWHTPAIFDTLQRHARHMLADNCVATIICETTLRNDFSTHPPV